MVEDDLWRKTTFGGRQLLVEDDPCMLPSPLCGIFFNLSLSNNHCYSKLILSFYLSLGMVVVLVSSKVRGCLVRQDTVASLQVVEYEEGVGAVTRLADMREEEERETVDQL